MKKYAKGFGVIEVLIVVAMLVIFVAVFWPVLFSDNNKTPPEEVPKEMSPHIRMACSIEEGDVIVVGHADAVATYKVTEWGYIRAGSRALECEYSCGYKNRRWEKACMTLEVVDFLPHEKEQRWFSFFWTWPSKGDMKVGQVSELVKMLQTGKIKIYPRSIKK